MDEVVRHARVLRLLPEDRLENLSALPLIRKRLVHPRRGNFQRKRMKNRRLAVRGIRGGQLSHLPLETLLPRRFVPPVLRVNFPKRIDVSLLAL